MAARPTSRWPNVACRAPRPAPGKRGSPVSQCAAVAIACARRLRQRRAKIGSVLASGGGIVAHLCAPTEKASAAAVRMRRAPGDADDVWLVGSRTAVPRPRGLRCARVRVRRKLPRSSLRTRSCSSSLAPFRARQHDAGSTRTRTRTLTHALQTSRRPPQGSLFCRLPREEINQYRASLCARKDLFLD